MHKHNFQSNTSKILSSCVSYLVSKLVSLDRSASSSTTTWARDEILMAVAVTARALQVARSPAHETAFELLSKTRVEREDAIAWGSGRSSDSTVATAMALLVYADRGEAEALLRRITAAVNGMRVSSDAWLGGSTSEASLRATEALLAVDRRGEDAMAADGALSATLTCGQRRWEECDLGFPAYL